MSDALTEAEAAIEEALALIADIKGTVESAPTRPALTVIKGGKE